VLLTSPNQPFVFCLRFAEQGTLLTMDIGTLLSELDAHAYVMDVVIGKNFSDPTKIVLQT
jgi:hypothetical protein